MTKRNFFSVALTAALLAGSIVFYSCNEDDDLTPGDDGRATAQQICDSFKAAAGDYDAIEASIAEYTRIRDTWKEGAEREAFVNAFNAAFLLLECDNITINWIRPTLIAQAISDFCAYFTANPTADEAALYGTPLGMKYVSNFYDPEFLNPVLDGLENGCDATPAWFFCSLGRVGYCETLTDDQAVNIARQAVVEFCSFFSSNPDAKMDQLIAEGPGGKYMRFFSNNLFMENVLGGLQGLLPESQKCTSVPDWFYCSFGLEDYCEPAGVTDEELAALGAESAQELCDCFSNATTFAEEQACMYGLMIPYGSYMSNTVFLNAHSAAWRSCTTVPDWYNEYWEGWRPTDDDTFAELGATAAQEMCDCFSNATTTAEEEACIDAFESKYDDYTSNHSFASALAVGLGECDNVPDWFEQGEDEDLGELGAQAATELCECFSKASDAAAQQACVYGLMPKYLSVMSNRSFTSAFTTALGKSCPAALEVLNGLGFGGSDCPFCGEN